MTLSIWEMFVALFRGGEEVGEESEAEEDESRFVPSPLDLSVRVGHGGTDGERLRELTKISEQAREIEERQHDN